MIENENESESVIEIQQDELLDNLDHLIHNSKLFSMSSNVNSINVCVFYIENKGLQNYKKYEVQINKNTLKKKELLTLILNNNKHYTKKYDLTGIYQYKFTLKPEELKTFSASSDKYNFIKSHNKVEELVYDPCIELFNSNNCLFLIFSKDTQKKRQVAKKTQESKDTNETNETDSDENKSEQQEEEIISLNDSKKIQKTQKKVRFTLSNSNNKKSATMKSK